MEHVPVLMDPIVEWVRQRRQKSKEELRFLDVTAGGGGHFFRLFNELEPIQGECWDRDSRAEQRLQERARSMGLEREKSYEFKFVNQCFGRPSVWALENYDVILADLGVSSFQLEDKHSGMSLHGEIPPDFRMDPSVGNPFRSWLRQTPEHELADILFRFGEEPKSRKLAQEMKTYGDEVFVSAKAFADQVAKTLQYFGSRVHPATRTFQALRIAINSELDELSGLLTWAPQRLNSGGVLMIISFHSLEDRLVKNAFRNLVNEGGFDILSKKPVEASGHELALNRRSRSAKLRGLRKL